MQLVQQYQSPQPSNSEPRHSYEPRPSTTPSPPHAQASAYLRPSFAHQRKDSETLRNEAPALGSPTINAGRPAFGGGRDSIPPSGGGYLAQAAMQSGGMQRHRRSPTAPQPPTTSGQIAPPTVPAVGKTWAGNDGRESLGRHLGADNYLATNGNGDGEIDPHQRQSIPPLQQQQSQSNGMMLPPPVPTRQMQPRPESRAQPQAMVGGPKTIVVSSTRACTILNILQLITI